MDARQIAERISQKYGGGRFNDAQGDMAKEIELALGRRDARIERLEGYLERANWRRCDIPACNCNGYHNWNPSREEIEAPLKEANDALEKERNEWRTKALEAEGHLRELRITRALAPD